MLVSLSETEWVLCLKPLFGGPRQALGYFARYTHRVAVSHHRLRRFEGEYVVFTWCDRAQGDIQRMLRVHAQELLGPFLLHVLPDGFGRIRSYGLLADRRRWENLSVLGSEASVVAGSATAKTSSSLDSPAATPTAVRSVAATR